MKKFILLIIAFILALSLVACEQGNDNNPTATLIDTTANPQSTPESTPGNEMSQEQLLEEVVKNGYKNGVYEAEFLRKDDEKNTDTSDIFNSKESYVMKLNEEITEFSGVSESGTITTGLYYLNHVLYAYDSYSNTTYKLEKEIDVQSFTDMIQQIMIDIESIIKSAKETTVTKLEDGSYGITLVMDTSRELSFINVFINESFLGLPFSLSTTECKVNLVVSNDYYVNNINIELMREGTDSYTDYEGNETLFFIGYSISYKLSYIGENRIIEPPVGMDIENAEVDGDEY